MPRRNKLVSKVGSTVNKLKLVSVRLLQRRWGMITTIGLLLIISMENMTEGKSIEVHRYSLNLKQ